MTSPRKPRPQSFKVGDTVRFLAGGKIDWEVTGARPHELFRGIQRLQLESGMSGTRRTTTNEYVIPREEALRAQV